MRVQVEEATCFSAVKYVMQMSLRVIVLIIESVYGCNVTSGRRYPLQYTTFSE